MRMTPVIGITPSPSLDAQPHGSFRRYALNEAYAAAIADGGGLPIVLPTLIGDIGGILDFVDGLLVTGGADIDPARYGASLVDPTTYGVDDERDRFEIELVSAAIDADLPLLGICRGIQVLNVALGGSLVQDIPSDIASPIIHRQQELGLPADAVGHDIEIGIGDYPILRDLFDDGTLGVNSFHHQAIDRVAPSLIPVARARDGVIEAVIRPNARFVVGLQWHPELMFRSHPEHLRPFAALVSTATARRLVGTG